MNTIEQAREVSKRLRTTPANKAKEIEAADTIDALIAELAALKQQEPFGAVLVNVEDEEAVMFYSPNMAPDMATVKDKFALHKVYLAAGAQPAQEQAVVQGQADPIPDELSDNLERSDWTPKEALEFYAAGNHYDTVDGRARILDNGAIASNALKELDHDYAIKKGDVALTQLRRDQL